MRVLTLAIVAVGLIGATNAMGRMSRTTIECGTH